MSEVQLRRVQSNKYRSITSSTSRQLHINREIHLTVEMTSSRGSRSHSLPPFVNRPNHLGLTCTKQGAHGGCDGLGGSKKGNGPPRIHPEVLLSDQWSTKNTSWSLPVRPAVHQECTLRSSCQTNGPLRIHPEFSSQISGPWRIHP